MNKVESLESRVEGQNRGFALRSYSDPRPSTLDPRPARLRRAMTLIELLAVIVIITTIVAAAIPLISPTNDDRRLREAARGLNTYIIGAQSRAIALRRPVGVALKRLQDAMPQDNARCASKRTMSSSNRPTPVSTPTHGPAWRLPEGSSVLIRFVTRGPATTGLPIGWSADLFPTRHDPSGRCRRNQWHAVRAAPDRLLIPTTVM